MTELLTRPPAPTRTTPDPASSDGAASVWWRGCLAAGWAIALGLAILVVLVLVVWATDSRSGAGAGGAVRTALQLWLAAHKVPLHVRGGSVAVAPLGLTLGLAFLVARAAAVLARGHGVDRPLGVVQVAAAVGVPYAVGTSFVAAAATSSAARPGPGAALAGGAVLGGVAAAWGAARGSGLLSATLRRLPARLDRPLVAGAIAVGALFASGLLLTLGSLLAHVDSATAMADALGGGVLASTALFGLDALLLPNAALTAIGYVSGPGFAVGTGSSVSLAGSHTGALPSLPLLAAVPQGPAPTSLRLLAVAVLILAGGAAGWSVARGQTTALRAAGAGAVSGVVAGVLAAIGVAVAGGPAGVGRMGTVGASPWQVGLAVAAEIGCVAAVTAAALSWRRR